MSSIWIGTSGWDYPDWRGRFYPSNLPAREQLAYYARHFPTVELNRSFYRLPTFEQFRGWAEQVAPYSEFRFAVKASRYLTHLKKLSEPQDSLSRLLKAASGLGQHLKILLFQLPPRWHADPARLEQVLSLLPADVPAAVEVRDPSWASHSAPTGAAPDEYPRYPGHRCGRCCANASRPAQNGTLPLPAVSCWFLWHRLYGSGTGCMGRTTGSRCRERL